MSVSRSLPFRLVLADNGPIRFDSIPALMAAALHPGEGQEFSREVSRATIEKELRQEVLNGTLKVRDPGTLGPQSFPVGANLSSSVVIPGIDLAGVLADRLIEIQFMPSVSPSRAPEPIKPLSGRGSPSRTSDPIPSANWSKWGHMRDVELWQAVALTLDLEPEKLPVYLGAYEAYGDDPFRICPKAYMDRLEVANSNVGTSFSANMVHSLRARSIVDLPVFGTWAGGVWENLHAEYPTSPSVRKSTETTTAVQPIDWARQAQDLAKQFIKDQKARDLFPGQLCVADHVANIMREKKIYGVDGKPLTGAYIKRHALKGITSATNRAKSTASARGK